MPSSDKLIQQAIRLCQTGKKNQAAGLLMSLLRSEPTNEQGWWLLTACVDSAQKQQDCLERVLRINPNHIGASLFIDLLKNNQTLPDLYSPHREPQNPSNINSENSYAQTAPFQSIGSVVPENPEIEKILQEAQKAEESQDFSLAYSLYENILNIDSSHMLAWLGKGYTSGHLSSPDQNRIPDFFYCLSQAVLSRDHLGLPIDEAITRMEPVIAQAASDRLLKLAHFSAQLAMQTPQPMANVYAVERVHLTDWAYAIGRRLDTQAGLWCSRAELVAITMDAFQRIIKNVVETNPNTRARQDRLKTLKAFLLSNLATSGLNRDPEVLKEIEDMLEQGINMLK